MEIDDLDERGLEEIAKTHALGEREEIICDGGIGGELVGDTGVESVGDEGLVERDERQACGVEGAALLHEVRGADEALVEVISVIPLISFSFLLETRRVQPLHKEYL